ncbi:PAS domain S-box protein [Methanovulcanius yangii]|uniref:PAS domain S-box protein n=1 Tax=Methanovulcanius yangii TaxID=1789227 RepID=UPI0029C9EBE9|nr:PAS domain S-box protein [Methanovulcanius yangii]
MGSVREIVAGNPKGLSITEIADALHIHRNTAARYLDILMLRGDVDIKQSGAAKNYYPARRIPVAALLAYVDEPAVIVSRRMEVAQTNQRALDLFGCGVDALYGISLEELPHSIFRDDGVLERVRLSIQGTPGSLRLRARVRGEKRALHLRFPPVVFDNGKEGCAIVFADETEYRTAKEHAGDWQERYEALTMDQTESIVHLKPDMTVTFANPAFCRRTGRSEDELRGLRFLPMVSAEGRERVKDILTSLTADEPARTVEVRTVLPEGTLAWEKWTFRALFGEGARVTGFHAAGHDITALKNCTEQLRQYHENLEALIAERIREMQVANRSLLEVIAEKEALEREILFTQFAFDHASDSILLFDAAGKVYKANRTAEDLLGYRHDELGSITVFDVNPSISKERWERMWAGAVPGKKERSISVHRRKDGTVIDVEVSRTFVQYDDRMYFCSIAREVGTATE